MTLLVIPAFLGRVPRRGPRLLEDTQAVAADDVKLVDGYLRPRRSSRLLTTLPSLVAGYLYRVREAGVDYWLKFASPEMDVVRSPLVNDSHKRYYFCGVGVPPSFNTTVRIVADQPLWLMGRPRPLAPPVLSIVAAGSSDIEEDRFYVYTYIDNYGHESAPSDPADIEVKSDEHVLVEWTDPLGTLPEYPAVQQVRIYRTVPGISQTSFFLVATRNVVPNTYTDSQKSSRVALRETLPSTTWSPPPVDLEGFIVMPNGYMVGWRGKDLMFSEPFRPHAWPESYTLSGEDEIVGLATFENNIAVMTTGIPYMASGVSPDAVSLLKLGPRNPCVSRRSIVPITGGALYAGEEGLMMVSLGGLDNITYTHIDGDQWAEQFHPETLIAARSGLATYLARWDETHGFEIDLRDPGRGVTNFTAFHPIGAFNQDPHERWPLITSGDEVRHFLSDPEVEMPYRWVSKEFFMSRDMNFGAVQINRAEGLGTSLTFTLIADGVERFSGAVVPDQPFKLPSNYEAQVFQFRLEGDMPVSRLMIASTEKELANA